MKRLLFSVLALTFSALPLVAENTSSEPKLFAALAMTKSQNASPVPTDSGLFLYDNEAQRWRRFGPTIQAVNSIASDPSNPATLFLSCGNGIVRSQNGGTSWRMVTGWRESDITKVAVDPSNGENVYAATAWGVTISKDGGDTWSAANEGLIEKLSKSIIIDHLNPNRLILATTAGLFESNDQAQSWTEITTPSQHAILGLDHNQSDPDLWIAGTEGSGVILSKDNGKTWQSTAPALAEANIYGIATNHTNSQAMAAGGWGTGIWVSHDGGATWTDRSAGLPSTNISKTTFDQVKDDRLWVSTFEEGTFYSDDLGKTWHTDDIIKPGAVGSILGAYVIDLGFVSISK